MRKMLVKEYVRLPGCDGVTCEFCGDTTWITDDEASKAKPGLFYHCDGCPFDLCELCSDEIQANASFHTVCAPVIHATSSEDHTSASLAKEDPLLVVETPSETSLAAACKWLVEVRGVGSRETSDALLGCIRNDAVSIFDAPRGALQLRFRSRVGAEFAKANLCQQVSEDCVTLTRL